MKVTATKYGISMEVVAAPPGDDDKDYDKSAAQTEADNEAFAVLDEYEQEYYAAARDETFDTCEKSWMAGETVDDDFILDYAIQLSLQLSPDEINALAANGIIHDEDADMLIMLRGLVLALPPGTSTDVIEQGMINFYRLSDEDQAFALDVMSSMTETHTYYDYDYGSSDDGEVVNYYSSATAEQEVLALYLCGLPTDAPLDHLQDCCNAVVAMGDAKASIMACVDEFQSMSQEEQQQALDNFVALVKPVIQAAVDNFRASDKTGIKAGIKEGLQSLAELRAQRMYESQPLQQQLFLCCSMMINILLHQMHGYYAQEQVATNNYTDASMAGMALDDAISESEDGTVDLYSVTFENHNGEDINLVLWCQDEGIDLPTNPDLSDEELQEDEWWLEALANPPDEYQSGVPDPPTTDEEKQAYIQNQVYEMDQDERNAKQEEIYNEMYTVPVSQANALDQDIDQFALSSQGDMDEINLYLTTDAQYLQVYCTIFASVSRSLYNDENSAANDIEVPES